MMIVDSNPSPDMDQLTALRALKNQLIGHPEEKTEFTKNETAFHDLVEVVRINDKNNDIRMEAITCIATLLYSNDEQIVLPGIDEIANLALNILSLPECPQQLQTLCLRVLAVPQCMNSLDKIVGESLLAICEQLLTSIVQTFNENIGLQSRLQTFYICKIVSEYVGIYDTAGILSRQNILKALIQIIVNQRNEGDYTKCLNSPQNESIDKEPGFNYPQYHAMRTLRTIISGEKELASMSLRLFKELYSGNEKYADSSFPKFLHKLLHKNSVNHKMMACAIFIAFVRAEVLTQTEMLEMQKKLFPCLYTLLENASGFIEEFAPLQMAFLLSENEALQQAASETRLVMNLGAMLDRVEARLTLNKKEKRGKAFLVHMDNIKHGVLVCIGALTLFLDVCRKQVIDAHIVPHIVSGLQNPNPKIRCASCQCIRTLSRSVWVLQTYWADTGIPGPIIDLLDDPELEVRTSACAALCNIILEFSPLRKALLERNVLSKLGALVCNEDPNLKLNALWALKHVVYKGEAPMKREVLKTVGSSRLLDLCNDPHSGVAEQALDVLRNILCGKEDFLDEVIEQVGQEPLLTVLREKFQFNLVEILSPTVYIVVHIAGGSIRQKNFLFEHSELLKEVLRLLQHVNDEIRLGCVWVIINLTWSEVGSNDEDASKSFQDEKEEQQNEEDKAVEKESDKEMLASIGRRLRDLGFEKVLQGMTYDTSVDVRDRVATALQQLRNTMSENGDDGSTLQMDTSGSAPTSDA